MPQNFVSLGLDTSGFSDGQYAKLEKFVGLFKQLDSYSGKVINPVFGSGLTEFNNTINASRTLLDGLNEKLAELKNSLTSTSGPASKVIVQTEELTEETAKLAVELELANKLLLDNAKAQNDTLQARAKQVTAANNQRKAEKELEAARVQANAENKRRNAEAAANLKSQEQQFENARRQAIQQNKELDASKAALIRRDNEEAAATQALSNKLQTLKNIQKEQSVAFTNNFVNLGKNAPQTQQSLTDLTKTSTVINDIEKNLNKATEGAGKFGRGISSAFSQIRTLAYILPGIGIAGLFNVAFEAIGEVIKQLDLFPDSAGRFVDSQLAINKALQDFVKIEKEVEDAYRTNLGDVQASSDAVKNSEASNRSFRDQLILKKQLQEFSTNKANAKFFETGGFTSEAELRVKLDAAEESLRIARNAVLQNEQGHHTNDPIGFGNSDELNKKKLENAQLAFDIARDEYNKQKHINEDNATQLEEYQAQRLELIEFNLEEERKLKLNNAKREADEQKSKNELLLAQEISSLQTRVQAIKNIAAAEQKAQQAQQAYIKSRPDSYNTINEYGQPIKPQLTTEALTAIKDSNQKIQESKRESEKKQYDIIEDYRQRRIKADAAMAQNEVEQSAIRDEKIYKNETKSLEERIAAYISYVEKKQKLEDIQFNTDVDNDRLKSNDPTAREEVFKLDSDRLKQKSNIQADVEKQIYEIVYTSTKKQLDLITAENHFEEQKHRQSYSKQLFDLNESFRKKEISYRNYNKKRNEIDYQYGRESLDKVIIDDEKALKRNQTQLEKLVRLREEARAKLAPDEAILNITKEEGGDTLAPQAKYDKDLGEFEGYQAAVVDAEKKTHDSVNKLEDDTFKRNSLRAQQDQKNRARYFQAIRQIEESLYRTIKQLGDQSYQDQLEKLRQRQQTIDQQYSYEKNAIDKSSLDAKNKAALDIQNEAQRRQQQEQTAREERRIKHDQAVFDRDIAIAHIILSTAEAVAASLEFPILAIAAGVAGAAELVVAERVRIPSYAKGVKDKKEAGLARYGEAGWEVVKEPYKSPYLVTKETIGWLPKGTDVIPFKDHPELGGSVPKDDSWKQSYWMIKQMKKILKPANVVNNITIDLGLSKYKSSVLGR